MGIPNELLDEHEINPLNIRKSYDSLVETILLGSNSILLIGGVLFCWYCAFVRGIWILLVNPPVFIILFSLPTLLFVKRWRAFSKGYEQNGSITEKWGDVKGFTVDFLYPVGAVVFNTAWFLIGVSLCLRPSLGLLTLIWIVLLGLGPIQYFYFWKTKKKLIKICNNSYR
jgi:hypothetical protein